jgi:hypothetical protein
MKKANKKGPFIAMPRAFGDSVSNGVKSSFSPLMSLSMNKTSEKGVSPS